MQNKIKLLFLGIVMNCAGTEKSFLSFLNGLDFEKYDVDLLLAKKEGALINDIPEKVNVYEIPDRKLADMFLLSGKNSVRTIWNCFIKRNPLVAFEVFPYFVGILADKKHRADIATRLWCRLLGHFSVFEKEYDVAVAYWGDRTMFYMADKIKAKKKITWLHFDFDNPPRDEKLYLSYFEKCDGIVTVSYKINKSLKEHFPSMSDKCITIENLNNPEKIIALSKEQVDFRDGYRGLKVLSVGRIAEQKGFDMAIRALKILRDAGVELRYYIIGSGDEEYVNSLKALAVEMCVPDMVRFLGEKENPYPFIANCDIYLQPSRYEGKPITVDEAKILAVPIIATNYMSASEQLEGGNLGVITEISPEGIAEGIKSLAEKPEMRDNFTKILKNRDFSNRGEIEKFDRLVN